MILKFKKLSPNAMIPKYQTEHSAAMDISALLDEPLAIKPSEWAVVPTGISFETEIGYEVQIRARSGLAAKNGIGLVNGVGTIDADFRGELKIILINYGKSDFIVENGDRIAQMLVAKVEPVIIKVVDELSETERGGGSFGSTGV